MTTYSTQNPIGSTDPRDLYDNAENLDSLVNGEQPSYDDRLGKSRKSWAGMEQDFADFLASSGYQFLGDYAEGITVTAYNQVIRDGGEFWRAAAGTELPYTATGAGMPEGGAFAAVGDAVLRQDLANPDKGAAMVARSIIVVNSVSEMTELPGIKVGSTVRTLGYYTPGDGGGNDYEIVAAGTGTADGKAFIDLGNGLQARAISQSLSHQKKTSSRRHIVILTTGQSNMVGSSLILGGDQSTDPRVFAWNGRVGTPGTAIVSAQLGQAPFNGGGQQHIGFNAAKYMAQMMDIPVYIINIASGGVNIDRWIATDTNPKMWTAIQTEVAAALSAIGADTVDYVMWHQGEANAADDVISYRNRLRTIKSQMESEPWFIKGYSRMIVGGLAIGLPTTGTSGARDSMNLGLDLFCETDAEALPVPTYDLKTDATGIHFTDDSIIEIGKRYAKAAMYPAPYVSRISSKRVVDGNVNFTIDPAATDNFSDIESFLHFLGTLSLTPNARVDVLVKAGKYTLSTSPRLSFEGTFIRFYGELSSPFSKPVAADFSTSGAPDKAADLAMLRAKYLTEIEIAGSVGLVLGGNNCGYWQDILFSNPAPALGSSAIRSNDPNLFTPDGGRLRATNCVFHGWDGPNNKFVETTGGSSVDVSDCIASHCTSGIVAINSRVTAQRALLAHCGRAADALKFSFIDAAFMELHAFSGTSYAASGGSVVWAVDADNNTSTVTATGGAVVV